MLNMSILIYPNLKASYLIPAGPVSLYPMEPVPWGPLWSVRPFFALWSAQGVLPRLPSPVLLSAAGEEAFRLGFILSTATDTAGLYL